jgi:hypothetical protein
MTDDKIQQQAEAVEETRGSMTLVVYILAAALAIVVVIAIVAGGAL